MKKLAVIVGHNEISQGAVRRDTGETEWVWNSRLAAMMRKLSGGFPDMEVGVFFREPMGGYSRELRDVYRRTDLWGADATVELHFNSHSTSSATGTETLTSGTSGSMLLAKSIQDAMLDALGLKDRGEKTVTKTDRGGLSLFSGKAPAALVEPFFGSSPKGLVATDEGHEMTSLAHAILTGADKMLNG